ncbi:MAG: Purine nucleoside phosphorylase 1 [Flavobacteriales bacterium]|nr:Purine nucleoside phosphorylase 1 [Flavobacteriales bacterium]
MKEIKEAASYLQLKGISAPLAGIILGTGLGGMVKEIEIITEISYSEIPHFPVSTVESHSGKLIYGTLHGKKVLAMQGRFHYYEGYSLAQVTFPVRVMHHLGIKYLLISNAAGTVNEKFRKGSLMLLNDHINLLPDNPLRGKNLNELGPRFPNMSQPYSLELNKKLEKIAAQNNIMLHQGVYAVVSGPNLETRAEYRFMQRIGADAVGMSTVPECIVANHMGLPCCAISVLTDECYPETLKPVDIAEIIAVANETEKQLTLIYSLLIREL